MKRIHKILAGTAGALTLAAVTAVAAAPYGAFGACDEMGPGAAGAARMGMMQGGMGPGAYGAMRGGGPGLMSAQRLDQLKTELALTSEQEAAWQAFSAKATEQASLMQATHEQHWKAAGADTTAPARMTMHTGSMTQHLAGMQAMGSALSDLYAVLTPQQRSTVDQYFGPRGQRGFGRGMHG
ncbi:MAG: Spy/CpxP family protein refolding chaperone [Burkholderiaceae bacterium]